jgi:RecT family
MTTVEAATPEVIAQEMAKDREQRREERQALTQIPAADLASSPSRMQFMPQSMGEAMQMALIMSRSSFVPQHCRGNEGNCLAIIMQAARWGMDPFAVANKSYFTKDGAPPAFESQLINAVVNSSGVLLGRLKVDLDGEGEKLRCTVRGRLRADPEEERVKTQHISRITVRNSPLWKSDPEQQLLYYTTRAWARAWAPEVLLGVFTPEELDEQPRAAQVLPPASDRVAQPARDEIDEEIERQLDQNFDPKAGQMVEEVEAEEETPAQDLPDLSATFKAWGERLDKAEVIGDVLAVDHEFNELTDYMSGDNLNQWRARIATARAKFQQGGR